MALFAVWREHFIQRPLEEVVAALREHVPFEPEYEVSFRFESRGEAWRCAAFSVATRFLSAHEQVSVGSEGFCVIHGLAWRVEGGNPTVETAQRFLATPSAYAGRQGSYAALTVDATGRLGATTDQHGLHHVYFTNKGDQVVVANRAGFVAAIAREDEPDLSTASWLTAIGYRIGERTAYAKVRQLPQGTTLGWANGSLSVIPRDDWALDVRGQPRGYGDAASEIDSLIDAGIEEAIAAVRLAFQDGDQITLPMSGGKDSRVVLALALAAGSRVRLSTHGHPDHPDVVVARQIAESYKLDFFTSPPTVARIAPVWAAGEFLARVARFSRLTEGMLGAWDRVELTGNHRRVTMTGHLGEILKAYAKRDFDPEDIDVLDLVRLQAPFDSMGVLKDEVVARMRSELRSQLEALRTATGLDTADLPDAFYYRNRIPNWLGDIVQAWSTEAEHIMPLGVPSLVRAAFRLTAAERKQELIHLQVLRRLEPRLLSVPFAAQAWDPALAKYLPKGTVAPPVLLPPGSRTPMHGGWQYTLNHNPELRSRLSELAGASQSELIWSVVERARLLRSLREKDLGHGDVISVLGLLASLPFQSVVKSVGSAARARSPRVDELGFKGFLDRVTGEAVVRFSRGAAGQASEVQLEPTGPVRFLGWLWCPDFPSVRVAVELIHEDGSVVARVPANHPRADLRAADIGDGKHGFELSIDAAELRPGHGDGSGGGLLETSGGGVRVHALRRRGSHHPARRPLWQRTPVIRSSHAPMLSADEARRGGARRRQPPQELPAAHPAG